MNEGELRTKAGAPSEARVEAAAARPELARPPLQGVTLLLPVWGYRFVSQFLEFCLPTLLAPGNVPAIAADLPCRFVLLSSEADEPVIRSHPAWQRLARICTAEVRSIDDLITDGNHTATITLAFARAVREAGDAMLDTCFIFLVSDYLVADGSLRSVVARIRGGASGVVAGNYQIVAEDAIPLLRRRIDPASPSIVLPPRALVRWSLAHLHPATVANIVNFGLSHNVHTNRLFWRVDEDTLIGRFYLMHPIGIRPEVSDFVIGASCDYSFIPEMCLSGKVVALTDSDEYLVVEMQPRDHEHKNLLPGPVAAPQLAESLSEWTTADHRRNVEHALVYHAAEIPPTVPQFVAEADAFVDRVRALLPPQPHPHRHHHYWIGSIAVNRARSRRPLSKKDWEFLLGETTPTGGLAGLVWSLRTRILGSLPDVTRLHPRWPDYGLPFRALKPLSGDGRLLLVAPDPMLYAQWLTRATNEIETLECDRLVELTHELYLPLVGKFDVCLMVLNEGRLGEADELIARAGPMLRSGGRIMIMVTNDRPLEDAAGFSSGFAYHSARLFNSSAWLTEVHYVPASHLRWSIYRALHALALRGGMARWRSLGLLPLLVFAGGPLVLASYLCNLGARTCSSPPPGLWSSVFMILRSVDGAQLSFPAFEKEQRRGTTLPFRRDEARKFAVKADKSTHQTDGTFRFGDPERVTAALACGRFVAGLLAARNDVAQYGADALIARLTLPKVKKLAVYDAETSRIGAMLQELPEDFPVDAHVHDILSGPLPKRYDSIYCFETMQYVSRSDEDACIRNFKASLGRDQDLVIIGSPCVDRNRAMGSDGAEPFSGPMPNGRIAVPETDALIPVRAGFVATDTNPTTYVRSGEEMKALLDRHFHDVFIFSMVNDLMVPGTLPSAEYVIALACARRT